MNEFSFLTEPAVRAAPRLLGCVLEREIGGNILRVMIVEVEAYDQSDTASHSYNGRTSRTDVMFGPPGHLYVYFTYGMHYCCNIVTGPKDYGAAVLIRAVEPMSGVEVMETKRLKTGTNLTNGPAKLCQALAIDRTLNGHNLTRAPLKLIGMPEVAAVQIVTTTRVGISKAKDVPWRFYIKDNRYVSKM